MKPRDSLAAAISTAAAEGRVALVGFLTAGFPSRRRFKHDLTAVMSACDVVEIGVPFSDPMADGTTIQRASLAALADGVTLPWIFEELEELLRVRPAPGAAAPAGTRDAPHGVPVLLMSYLNPLLKFGFDELPRAAVAAGVAGFIVPDLPYEESAELKAALDQEGLALVQMVSPVTPAERLAMLCKSAEGFVYAVTMTGTTGATQGASAAVPDDVLAYMDRVKSASAVPVCAGFGIRSATQVARFAPHVDGVIIGSALVEALERGDDVALFLRSLRQERVPQG
ncbi:MAG: tryptophan synthase subunit alpha [Pseudomonadota bacterium]|nr:tryptophan synthase subunit alpha [Pseudomonadota bacterium]